MESEKQKKLTKFIKTGLINAVVVGVGLAYIFFTMVTIKMGEVNILELLGKSVIGIICGIMIKQGLGENGITRGYNSEIWNKELGMYNDACNKANPYMERVDNFYYCQEIEKRKSNRRAIMMAARLKYSEFFDEHENFIGQDKIDKLSKFQKQALHKCVKLKVYNLNLFSEYASVTTTDTKKETGDKEQRAKMFGKNSISQIAIAVAGAYFVPMLNEWNWATFIFSTLQVLMWCASGVMQMHTNYNYVVVDKVNKIKRKKELIQKFIHGCDEGLYKENPYELRAQEERRIAEEKKALEELKLAEEKRKLEEKLALEEQKRAEEERRLEERRLAEEQRRAEKRRLAEQQELQKVAQSINVEEEVDEGTTTDQQQCDGNTVDV